MKNCEFREFALNEPNLFHYATLNFPRQFLVPAPSRASSATPKRSPIALRAQYPSVLGCKGRIGRGSMLTLSEVHAIAWALVQGARRATELDARLDTSLGAILYSMPDTM